MSFFAYVGTLDCGCSPAACVDEPKFQKDTAKAVSDMIKGGMTVTRVEVKDGETIKIHSCIHKVKEVAKPQRELFA